MKRTFPQRGLGAPQGPVGGALLGGPPVVRGEDEEGVVGQTGLLQGPAHVAYRLVHRRHHAAVHAPRSLLHVRAVVLPRGGTEIVN